MPTFPEDEIEIFREYFPRDVDDLTSTLTTKLITGDTIVEDTQAGKKASAVNKARKKLRALLQHQNTAQTRDAVVAVYSAIRRAVPDEELVSTLDTASHTPDLPNLDAFTVNQALTAKALNYKMLKITPAGKEIEVSRVLPPYSGPALDAEQVSQLVDLNQFMRGGKEREFRLALLRAETRVSGADFGGALDIYNGMIAARKRGDPRRKLLSIRACFAHIARGLRLYRSSRDMQSSTIADASADFQRALDIVAFELIESDLRKEIEQVATAQRDRIAALINFAGYQNHHIPKGPSYEEFRTLALTRVGESEKVRSDFLRFLEAAEQADVAEREANNAVQQAEFEASAAKARANAAASREKAARGREALIDRRIAIEEHAKYFDYIEKAAALVKTGVETHPFVALAGATNFLIRLDVEKDELQTEKRLAFLAALAAFSDLSAAQFDLSAATDRADFLTLQRGLLIHGEHLNAHAYYDLAFAFSRFLEAHTSRSIELAFLAEKRALFELGNPTVPKLDFAAVDLIAEKIIAPQQIGNYLTTLNEFVVQTRPQQELTDFDLILSIRQKYPVEYFEFLETGRLVFKVTLAELDEIRPGTTNRRIERVAVTVDGLGSAHPNLSARLKHTGVFMLRDAEATMQSDQLLPPQKEIEPVLESFRLGAESVAALGGITLWQVEPAEKELTLLNDDEAIEEFANYGFTGTWEFEMLQSENPNIDLHQIQDIVIRMDGKCIQGSDPLREKVRELLKKHRGIEGFDRTSVISMHRSPLLRDAFKELRESGKTSFEVNADTFPTNIGAAQVKSVVFQAIDENQKGLGGLHLVLGSDRTGLTFDRTTRPDGFSEDVNLQIPILDQGQRFPMEGTWFVDGSSNQLSAFHDLILFFIHLDPSAEP